jgi:hypothetical protein
MVAVVRRMHPRTVLLEWLSVSSGRPQPNFSLAIFENITHLGLLGLEWKSWLGFCQLPRLSHVLLYLEVTCFYAQALDRAIATVADILSCPTLQVCLLHFFFDQKIFDLEPGTRADEIEEAIDDDRLTFLFQYNVSVTWDYRYSYMDEKSNIWTAAESAVLMQREHHRRGIHIRADEQTLIFPLCFPGPSST